MKLWGGRFAKTTDALVEDFHSSIRFDKALFAEDIEGSIAHASMLSRTGIISPKEADQIIEALQKIYEDILADQVTFNLEAEDIHMNIEQLLIQRIGDVGKKLHTARSRNDQVALDTRMYLKKQIQEIQQLLLNLEETLLDLAQTHPDTIMPGYTHLQKAQPITFAHHLLAYFCMFQRDYDRLTDCFGRTNSSPLGSGALAGTTFPIDREDTAKALGFAKVSANTLDGVSDRDFAIEFCSAAAIIMMHLSRFCEEVVLWSSNEFGFVTLDDAYSTGSSIMPQKKNPDVAELVRGKTGRVYGDLMALLTVMKGLPLAYNKDMQEDKETLFDAVDTVKKSLLVFAPMLATMKVNQETMRQSAKGGFTNATDMADYLASKGLPFREAHAVVGKLVLQCEKEKRALEDLSLTELKVVSPLFEEDIYQAITLETCVGKRNGIGGPAPEAVQFAIDQGKQWLKQNRSE